MVTAAAVRPSVHHGWTGRRVPGVTSRISISIANGKPKSTLKKTIWKALYCVPRVFTTTSWVAKMAKARRAVSAPRAFGAIGGPLSGSVPD